MPLPEVLEWPQELDAPYHDPFVSKDDRESARTTLDALARHRISGLTKDLQNEKIPVLNEEAKLLISMVEHANLLPFFVTALRGYSYKQINEERLFRKVIGRFAQEGSQNLIVKFSDWMPLEWKTNFKSNRDIKTKDDIRVRMVEGGDFELFGTFRG